MQGRQAPVSWSVWGAWGKQLLTLIICIITDISAITFCKNWVFFCGGPWVWATLSNAQGLLILCLQIAPGHVQGNIGSSGVEMGYRKSTWPPYHLSISCIHLSILFFWSFPHLLLTYLYLSPTPLPISISFLIYLSPKCLSLLSLHLTNALMIQKDTQLTSHATTLKMWQKASRKMPRRRTRSPSSSSSNPRRPALLNKTVMIVMST